jgi:hypothetical protein
MGGKNFIKIQYLGENETILFAAKELERYLHKMYPKAELAMVQRSAYESGAKNTLWVGRDRAFTDKLPQVPDSALDDGIYIVVKGGTGMITGTNERSVLLAVYRYLRELGCAWVFPGEQGERIPVADHLAATDVLVSEAASYRHRGICIEGAASYDQVLNMIKWLPKVGMNCYFNQFRIPFTFFDRWYTHRNNPQLEAVPVSADEVAGMVRDHISEIKKRGMFYHAVGHSWTCEPFGIEGNGWDVKEYTIPEEAEQFLAQVKGNRSLWGGIPLNTNLCYGNPEVRERMTDAIAAYCGENRAVDYVHFWLADNYNNHCECDLCKDTEPSDFYVMMMNLLDEKLTKAGLKTRIVFLLYLELLWKPKKEVLKNPDRFVLMFAPISRTYSTVYADAQINEREELEPYVRNRITLPREVSVNVARLRKWQEWTPGCDSFIYDYHYMWDHYKDPGYMDIGRVVFKDMQNLHKIGLNGMVSCQTQRAFFPNGIGMILMAEALWNKSADYVGTVERYFKAAYGADGKRVSEYLTDLSARFDPPYIRHEKPQRNPEKQALFFSIESFLDSFTDVIRDNLREEKNQPPGVRYSWELLQTHGELCRILAKSFGNKAAGNQEAAETLFSDAAAFARLHEPDLKDVFDVFLFIDTMKRAVSGTDVGFI